KRHERLTAGSHDDARRTGCIDRAVLPEDRQIDDRVDIGRVGEEDEGGSSEVARTANEPSVDGRFDTRSGREPGNGLRADVLTLTSRKQALAVVTRCSD